MEKNGMEKIIMTMEILKQNIQKEKKKNLKKEVFV